MTLAIIVYKFQKKIKTKMNAIGYSQSSMGFLGDKGHVSLPNQAVFRTRPRFDA